MIKEVVLSLRDESFEELFILCKKHSLSVQIVDDSDRTHKTKIKAELAHLQLLSADLGLSIGFPHKLSSQVIQQHQHGVINLHFAPLPAYRGSGTLSHAMINQEKEYGVTFHFIDEDLDTGPIIARKMISLPTDIAANEFIQQLEELSYQFFIEQIEVFLTEALTGIDQDHYLTQSSQRATLYTRASLETLYELSWEWRPEKILRYVYALSLEHGKKPYLTLGGKKVYLSLTET